MFLVVLSLCGIHEVRADEMSVEVVAVTPEPSDMKHEVTLQWERSDRLGR